MNFFSPSPLSLQKNIQGLTSETKEYRTVYTLGRGNIGGATLLVGMQRHRDEVMVGIADDSRLPRARGERSNLPLGAVWATKEDQAPATATTEPFQPSRPTGHREKVDEHLS